MTPKVSVIIPVYNVERYLPACLDSVLSQSFSDFEVICIDDCSTDSSYEILKKYAEKDSRIRLLQNKVNLKVAGTRNIGLDNARGKYVYFMDSDDYIDKGYLDEMWNMALASSADIAMNLNIHTVADGQEVNYVHQSMPHIPAGGMSIDDAAAIDLSLCVVWMRLFKRGFLEAHHIRFQNLEMGEDNVFHYVTNVHASSIFAFHGASSYHYVLHDDSVVGTVKSNNLRDYMMMKASDLVYDYLRDNDLLETNRAKLFNTYPFIKVDTEEKFALYKSYFIKIENFLNEHVDMYSETDLFFADSILSSESLEDYRSRHSENVAIAYLRNRNRKHK